MVCIGYLGGHISPVMGDKSESLSCSTVDVSSLSLHLPLLSADTTCVKLEDAEVLEAI